MAITLLVGFTSLVAIDLYRRNARLQWLVAEIEAANGSVGLPEPLLRQILSRPGGELDLNVFVHLRSPTLWDGAPKAWEKTAPPSVNAEWLHKHDYLTGLHIRTLMLGELPLTRAEFSELFSRHPIEEITYTGAENADDIAFAIAECRSLRSVDFGRTDLSDEGFQALPLERLTWIAIEDTQVDSTGLHEFRRCRQLAELRIDGTQLDIVIPELIEINKPLDTLDLYGPSVEDRHLERLHELKLNRLYLTETSVSDEAVYELHAKMRACFIGK